MMDAPIELVERALREVAAWETEWGPFEKHSALSVEPGLLESALSEYVRRLRGNYPFFHPRYAGQMLKPPHPIAVAAYAAAQRINPNNHALDGGPPTGQMEKEVVASFASMFGLPETTLGHLTGGGTVANLEALFVSRETHPNKAVAVCVNAHYTHARMCHVLGVEVVSIAEDDSGRMDLNSLEEHLKDGSIGTVVCTPGTTGLGVVDPISDIVRLAERHGARVHVDAAYGGFFHLIAGSQSAPDDFPAEDFLAIAETDSVVVDPHKHGLQPYGCGCVLFRDPSVGRFYRHDSPYTYFTSSDLHLGEISLECSRPGAAAGALWLTLRCILLEADSGLGPILAASLRAARKWADLLNASDAFQLYTEPTLDIVTFFPAVTGRTLSAIDACSRAVFDSTMNDPTDPIFLSLYRLSSGQLMRRHDLEPDVAEASILRSVLMKPEHEQYVEMLHDRVESVASEIGVSP